MHGYMFGHEQKPVLHGTSPGPTLEIRKVELDLMRIGVLMGYDAKKDAIVIVKCGPDGLVGSLSHEVIHRALHNFVGRDASSSFDNIDNFLNGFGVTG